MDVALVCERPAERLPGGGVVQPDRLEVSREGARNGLVIGAKAYDMTARDRDDLSLGRPCGGVPEPNLLPSDGQEGCTVGAEVHPSHAGVMLQRRADRLPGGHVPELGLPGLAVRALATGQ